LFLIHLYEFWKSLISITIWIERLYYLKQKFENFSILLEYFSSHWNLIYKIGYKSYNLPHCVNMNEIELRSKSKKIKTKYNCKIVFENHINMNKKFDECKSKYLSIFLWNQDTNSTIQIFTCTFHGVFYNDICS